MNWPLKAPYRTPGDFENLHITVVFTDVSQTRYALHAALKLAADLQASFEIVATRVVPYPLPLDRPPVSLEFTEKQISELLISAHVKATVRIHDCRDAGVALTNLLSTGSIVVMGSRKGLWPNREARLARRLRKAGHEVILAAAA